MSSVELRAARKTAVDDGEASGARERRLDRDRARRAAGAEHDERLAFDVDKRPQRLHEPDAVGVFADEFVAAPHHAIDGAHRRGGFAQAVEMGNDRHLMRQRAVEAAPAHGARAARRVAERRRAALRN